MAARDALPGHYSCLKGKSVPFARVGPPPVRPGGGFRSRRLIWQLPETTFSVRVAASSACSCNSREIFKKHLSR